MSDRDARIERTGAAAARPRYSISQPPPPPTARGAAPQLGGMAEGEEPEDAAARLTRIRALSSVHGHTDMEQPPQPAESRVARVRRLSLEAGVNVAPPTGAEPAVADKPVAQQSRMARLRRLSTLKGKGGVTGAAVAAAAVPPPPPSKPISPEEAALALAAGYPLSVLHVQRRWRGTVARRRWLRQLEYMEKLVDARLQQLEVSAAATIQEGMRQAMGARRAAGEPAPGITHEAMLNLLHGGQGTIHEPTHHDEAEAGLERERVLYVSRAREPYVGDADQHQVSFDTGAKVYVYGMYESGWGFGFVGGHVGYFPATFVDPWDAKEAVLAEAVHARLQ